MIRARQLPSYDVLGHYFHEVPSGSYKGAEPGECREYHDLEARAASASGLEPWVWSDADAQRSALRLPSARRPLLLQYHTTICAGTTIEPLFRHSLLFESGTHVYALAPHQLARKHPDPGLL